MNLIDVDLIFMLRELQVDSVATELHLLSSSNSVLPAMLPLKGQRQPQRRR